MMTIRGGCRPAWAAAAVDADYARRPLAACAARAVSPGGQARAGGRTDVKLLIYDPALGSLFLLAAHHLRPLQTTREKSSVKSTMFHREKSTRLTFT